ncbi:unnamed protein product [Discula destructiva]
MEGPKDQNDQRSDLFIHDTNGLQSDILLHEGASHLTYQEYAVFAQDYASTNQSTETTDSDRPFLKHTGQCIVSEKDNGDALFHQAVRDEYTVDIHGNWEPKFRSVDRLQGRVRQVTCHRRANPRSSEDMNLDGLQLTDKDYAAMDLHPATLQYVRRRAVESNFWDRHHEKLSIILSFPVEPQVPYDFLSMTYSIADRTTTTLIRQSFDPYLHALADLEQYDARMQACKSHWAHPLLVPVILLQIQFARTERAVAENHSEVIAVERDVSNLAGFDAFDSQTPQRRRRAQSAASGGSASPETAGVDGQPGKTSTTPTRSRRGSMQGGRQQVYKQSTELMKNAHDVLKKSIGLLDTLKWMERAVNILLEAGDELDDVRTETSGPTPQSSAFPVPLSSRGRVGTGLLRARIVDDPLAGHWHEIRQYLESLLQLCSSLGTDRKILEMRCNALVDIIYSKMAQEDNNLNARMAVASSRDSSSMKALAVITAVFLPGEFMSSLFGMGVFDWQTDDDSSSGSGKDRSPVISYDFWWYWATTIPLTIIILVFWRAWWVGQDRYFRKHLSKELSEERYWTDDRQPRQLETSFLYDFIYMSVRKGETSTEGAPAIFRASTRGSNSSDEAAGLKWFGRTRAKQDSGLASPEPPFRHRRIAFDEDIKPGRRNTAMV